MAASGGLALADKGGFFSATADAALPATAPGVGGISHVVVLMMENRSFDHLMGWFPGANGNQARTFPAPDGSIYPNYPLAPDYQGCGYSDPDHSWEGWLQENNHGANDGFLLRPTAPPGTEGVPLAAANTFPIGYYTNLNPDGSPKAIPDVPVLGALAQNYTLLDNYFSSFAGETYPNRFYQHAGRTDRDHNSTTTSTLPTIWDQLASTPSLTDPSQATGAYFFKDIPFLALWGTTYVPFWRPFETGGVTLPGVGQVPGLGLLDTIKAGLLPNVSYVDPSFESEDQGTSGDYHPLCDIRVGEKFISDVYFALSDAGYLSSTALVITFDEWGGFFDHVAPPQVTDTTDPTTVNHTGDSRPAGFPGPDYPDYTQLGFRVPTVVVSDYAPKQIVSDGPYEHASTLCMIESLFGLDPIYTDPTTGDKTRDGYAKNLQAVLSTTARTDDPSTSIPRSSAVLGPVTGAAAACLPTSQVSVSPAAVSPPPGLPEFSTPVEVPVGLAGTAGLAALGVRMRRQMQREAAAALLGGPEAEPVAGPGPDTAPGGPEIAPGGSAVSPGGPEVSPGSPALADGSDEAAGTHAVIHPPTDPGDGSDVRR
jgi:phospholipase C